MGALLQVVGSHPHFLFIHDPLLVEVGFAPVDEDQWAGLAIIAWKIELLEPRRAVLVVLAGAGARLGDRRRRAIFTQALDRLGVRLDRGLQCPEGGDQGV